MSGVHGSTLGQPDQEEECPSLHFIPPTVTWRHSLVGLQHDHLQGSYLPLAVGSVSLAASRIISALAMTDLQAVFHLQCRWSISDVKRIAAQHGHAVRHEAVLLARNACRVYFQDCYA